jgi:hypothetical protein
MGKNKAMLGGLGEERERNREREREREREKRDECAWQLCLGCFFF